MNTIDERAIRDQLERAVAPLDPVAPPLDALRERAARRRRLHYSLGAGVAVAAAAIVAVVLVVVPGGGSSKVVVGTAPSTDSLKAYAAAHHGKHVAGPIESGSGFFGAFAVKRGIQVVHYVAGEWQSDGAVVTKYGPGRWVMKIADAGAIIPGHPAFVERYQGGDVSYFGGVLSNVGGSWQAVRFAKCKQKELSCTYAGTSQPYGHIQGGRFVSIHNDCTPYCAAGTEYRVTWRWDAAAHHFTEASGHAIQE